VIVLVVGPGDLRATQIAAMLAVDSEAILNRDDGKDHLVVVADVEAVIAIAADAARASEIVREYLASGLLAPGSLLPVPPAIEALLRPH